MLPGQREKTPVLSEVKRFDPAKPEEARPFFIKAMLCGMTGSGKRQSASTLPKSKEHPLLLIDFDNRWETLRDEYEAGTIDVITLFDEDPGSPDAWDRAEDLKKELWASVRAGTFKYSGIIEATLSQMSRRAMNSALTLRGKDGKDSTGLGGTPSQGHWGAQIQYVVRHLESMRNLPCHYVLTAHFDLEKDEDDGKIKILPKITKSLRTEVPSWFNEVYLCSRETDKSGMKYFWTTAGTGQYDFFKSTMNNKQKYWDDPILIDFKKEPVGFELLMEKRFGRKQ